MKKTISLEQVKRLVTPWTLWVGLLGIILAAAAVGGILVFWHGLSITNLTDLVPWGLWITIDLSAIAIAGGAFALCVGVYLVGLKEYMPVARTAIWIGLLGYTTALLALILDIGRPDRFWHALVYWNSHSLLWEVTMCITLYLSVLMLEILPILATWEWLRKKFPFIVPLAANIHKLAPVLAVVGLCLSMLHQSSLGAVYGVLKARPVWYRPGVAVHFIVSAVIAGMAMTVFASMLSARLTKRAIIRDELLEKVSKFIGWALGLYLYMRFWDVLAMTYTYEPGRSEGLSLLTTGPLSFNFWIVEILFGAVLPLIILLNPATRRLPVWRMLATGMVVAGVIAYRWDVTMVGQLVTVSYLPGQAGLAQYTSYFPSLVEIITGAGLIAYWLMGLSVGIRYFHVVDHEYSDHHEPAHAQEPIPVHA